MHPTEILSREHRAIEDRLQEMETQIRAGENAAFARPFFERALDFFRNFADGCHHAKEENLLFPMMKERGVPEHGGPIGVMLAEHDEGRGYLRALGENLEAAEAGSTAARDAVFANASAYINLLRQHIYKEDQILFRLAQMVLQPDDVAELRKQFAAIELPERFRGLGIGQEAPAA